MSTTLITSRDPRGLAINSLHETAFDKARFEDIQAQRIIKKGGESQNDIVKVCKRYSVSTQFAGERVDAKYGYPNCYRPRDIGAQIDILRAYWPKLDPDKAWKCAKKTLSGVSKPAGAEAVFAIIRWQTIASSYGEALERELFKALGDAVYRFYNEREGQLGADRLRQCKRTVRMLAKLGKSQQSDILIVPAQFGKLHANCSVREVREVFTTSEFGLDAFAVGCMLLTHPERLVSCNNLWIDCPGDEYATPDAYGRFGQYFYMAPDFGFHDGRVKFSTGFYDSTGEDSGSASGFLPQ